MNQRRWPNAILLKTTDAPIRTPSPIRSDGRIRLVLISSLLIAFALRIYKLDGQSLWYDEGVTADVAQRGIAELTRWTANDIQPPLYYYLMAGWGRLAGWGEWSLRFPSVFFGVLTVPLLALLALRLTRRTRAGVLATFFTTLHPLLLYYSQEARMYALLTALGILTGYCVLKLAQDGKDRRFLLAYVLSATAAAYTHYFAFFLLLALGIAFLLDRKPHAARRNFLLANLLVLMLYIPWFTALFTRLAVDASYWQGRLNVWNALRSVVISFTSGATVRETQATWLLIPFALVTLMALLVLWRAADHSPGEPATGNWQLATLHYALPWLIVPVAAVLLLASFAPKFNPRYVMIALPGLILIWAAGLARLLEIGDWRLGMISRNRLISTLQSPISFIAIIFILSTSLYADRNWFFDRTFTKDDWRSAAKFLRQRLQPDETVLLISGHAWPVWHYYAPDIPVVRLPAIDVLDVNAVLTFANTVAPLQTAFGEQTGKTGAWIVAWQDDVVDPTGIVPAQLERAGREKGQPSTFWGLTLRRFSGVKPKHIVDAPPIKTVVDATFGNQLRLQGYTVLDNGDLLLFWQRLDDGEAADADFQISGEVFAADGVLLRRFPDQRPAGYAYPVSRWPLAQTVMGKIPAVNWLGEPIGDGTYRLRLSVYNLTTGTLDKLPVAGQDFIDLDPLTVLID